MLALGEVGGVELPPLGRVVDPLLQARPLLLGGDVEHDLHDGRALADEQLLERADAAEAGAHDVLADEAVDADDEHVLVVAAVEHGDLAVARRLRVDPPEEVVRELLGGGGLERGDAHALRVDALEHGPHRAVLAAGVHRLQDDEQRPRALRVQAGLQLGETGAQDG
nr:hypothetical protein [Conexibacter sp. W3-3-2]